MVMIHGEWSMVHGESIQLNFIAFCIIFRTLHFSLQFSPLSSFPAALIFFDVYAIGKRRRRVENS